MNNFKTIALIILAVAIAGFLIYKTYWTGKNVATNGNDSVSESIHADVEEDAQYAGLVDNIQRDIDAHSNVEILQCYRDTKDLREQLLNRKIKASEVIDRYHLVPPGMRFPKVNGQHSTKVAADARRSQSLGTPAGIDAETTFTKMADFFGNDIAKPQIPTGEEWLSYGENKEN